MFENHSTYTNVNEDFKVLSPWTYTSPETINWEKEQVFKKTWQFVCHVNDVPNSGDYFTFDILDDNILVIRDKEMKLHAFLNVCRHRASKLLTGKGNCKSRIQCPYHGWSYALDGELKAISSEKNFSGVNKQDFGLFEIALEVLHGFIYIMINPDPNSKSLHELWKPYHQDIPRYQPENYMPLADIQEEIWNVNWKVAWDNYLESYHIPIGHPALARILAKEQGLHVSEGGLCRGEFIISDKDSRIPLEAEYQQLARNENTYSENTDMADKKDRLIWRQYSCYPNLGLDYYAEMMDFFQIIPLNATQTRVRTGLYGLPDTNPKMLRLRELNIEIGTITNDEDRTLCESVQAGLKMTGYTPGPLSVEEVAVRQFHEMLRAAIPAYHHTKKPIDKSDTSLNV